MQLVILDRDGVINVDSPDFIKNLAEWELIPGSLNAIADLLDAGIKVVIASNQSGIGRGLFSLEILKDIEKSLNKELAKISTAHVNDFYYCPHLPDDGCECRKPKPGMLLSICKDFNIPKQSIVFIGDSLRDIQAARAAELTPCLVKTGNGEKTLADNPNIGNDVLVFQNLAEAVKSLLSSKDKT